MYDCGRVGRGSFKSFGKNIKLLRGKENIMAVRVDFTVEKIKRDAILSSLNIKEGKMTEIGKENQFKNITGLEKNINCCIH